MVAIALGVVFGLATEIDPLAPLPSFDAAEEESRFNEDDTPFPGDAGMFEDDVVDDGDV